MFIFSKSSLVKYLSVHKDLLFRTVVVLGILPLFCHGESQETKAMSLGKSLCLPLSFAVKLNLL